MPRMTDPTRTSELLRLHDAQVVRDGRVILDIADFCLRDGERVCILGPNGSGKSTLVKLLTREVLPVWRPDPPLVFHGDPRASLAEVSSVVSVVSNSIEGRQLRFARSALDVVLGGCFDTVGVPWHIVVTDAEKEAARRALADAGVSELADRDVRTLSTGQLRRVLVARALVSDHDVVAFDEPCAGLDPEATWNLRETFDSLARAGRGLLLVTHDVADITAAFERVVMLKDGRIVADGPVSELLETERLRALFGAPLTLVTCEGRYHLQ